MNSNIKHIFVLMLENRSFDHMLGFSDITGKDARDGSQTQIDTLSSDHFNEYNGVKYYSSPDAPYKLSVDPGHEFINTFKQICGPDAIYNSNIQYNLPKPMNGFVSDFVNNMSEVIHYGDVMKCYSKDQLPILNMLAEKYVICDKYFSSMPGPTLPNRLFACAASSNGLDDSPSTLEIIKWNIFDGIKFKNGTIYDALDRKGVPWKIYGGTRYPLEGSIPVSSVLKGITFNKWSCYDKFKEDIEGEYPYFYTLIEPNYGNILNSTYVGGSSMHPCDDVKNGELLIKDVYETIRGSKLWNNSVLIINFDEHGGFEDKIIPPSAIPPGDSMEYSKHNFNFNQLGVRVPALIISPLIEPNLIDHTIYDHTSILATIERLVGIEPLTERDKYANDFLHLFTRNIPRYCLENLPIIIPDNNKMTNNINNPNSEDKQPLPPSGNINYLICAINKINNELNLTNNIGTNCNEIRNNIVNIFENIEEYKKI